MKRIKKYGHKNHRLKKDAPKYIKAKIRKEVLQERR